MNPIGKIIGGVFLIVVGIIATVVVSAFTPIAMLFYGAVIAGLVMIAWGVFQLISRGILNIFPQLIRCHMGTDEDGNRLPMVFVPIKKAGRTFSGEEDIAYIMYRADKQQALADIIYNDLQHEQRYHPSGVTPWDTARWKDVNVLRDAKGNISHLCVLFDDGTVLTGDLPC